MAVTEEERHELHSWLEQQAGPQIAATLMKHLPPVGWMDVTTNSELDNALRALSAEVSARIDRVEAGLRVEFADFRAEVSDRLNQQTRTLLLGLVGSLATMTSLVLAAVGLAG